MEIVAEPTNGFEYTQITDTTNNLFVSICVS